MGYIKGFGKESETIDYTDRGKNIPEIKSDYKMTKEGFIEIINPNSKNSEPLKIAEDFDSIKPAVSNFDFLNDMAVGSSSSSFNTVPESIDDSEIKKQLRNVSSMAEQNSNEVYKLLQRIEMLEKKIELLENKS